MLHKRALNVAYIKPLKIDPSAANQTISSLKFKHQKQEWLAALRVIILKSQKKKELNYSVQIMKNLFSIIIIYN